MFAFLPVLLSAGWVVVLIATPLLPGWAGAVVYSLGAFVCHQLPDRSFHVAGFQLPVCARCVGIYVGASAGAAYVWLRSDNGRTVFPMAARRLRWLAVVAAAPTLVTVAFEVIGAWYPSNNTRALAGLPLGMLVGLVVMNALRAQVARRPGDACLRRRSLDDVTHSLATRAVRGASLASHRDGRGAARARRDE